MHWGKPRIPPAAISPRRRNTRHASPFCRRFRGLASLLVVTFAGRLRAAEPAGPPKLQYEFGQISVPAASADEPLAAELSIEKALAYLDDGANAWAGTRKCVSCHTNGVYLSLRPAPRVAWARPMKRFAISFWPRSSRSKRPPRSRYGGTAPDQVIYLAAGLAQWDRHIDKQLSPETDAALKLMFSIQRDDGTWGNVACWPPYESDMYHPATVAAMALADAPGWLENLKDEKLLSGVERLKQYLRTTAPAARLCPRAVALDGLARARTD